MNDINKLLYPDSGNPLEDASVLRNAVYFSTAERAYSARLLLQQLNNAGQLEIDFLVIRAFEEFMTSTEDLLGWLFTLQEWQPGKAEGSLFILLNKIQVGRDKYEEKKAISFLSKLDAEGFRELLHIPSDEDLIALGIQKELVESIRRGMPAKLEGWLKITKMRVEQDRGWVGMFNKVKHHLLAFPTTERGKNEIFIPFNINIDKKPSIHMGFGWVEASVNQIRWFAENTILAQAVLHDTLAVILITRYGEKYTVPQWVIKAYQTDYL